MAKISGPQNRPKIGRNFVAYNASFSLNKTPKNEENSIVFQVFFHSRLLEIIIASIFAQIAFAVNIFCEFACSFGQLWNGPRFFFLDFLQNIKEFELAKQFEGYLSDIYVTLCSKTALRRLKTHGFAFGLEFRPICMANFKRLLFGLLFSRIWAKFCSDRLVTLMSADEASAGSKSYSEAERAELDSGLKAPWLSRA